jgi:predicted permease
VAFFENVIHDARHGARLLARNPLFALTAILSIAIGIGANTTIFTIANGLLFGAPEGVADPNRVVDIFGVSQGSGPFSPQTSYPKYLDIRARSTTLESVYGFGLAAEPVSLAGSAGAERIYAKLVTTNYFIALGVRPAAGRLLGPADSEAPGASPVVVLTYAFWSRQFNKDPGVVGRTLQLNGQPFAVVGVAAEGFEGTNIVATDVWVPTSMASVVMRSGPDATAIFNAREAEWLLLGARLKPGISMTQARAELETINRSFQADSPTRRDVNGDLVPSKTRLAMAPISAVPSFARLPVAGFLTLLMLMVSAVLVIACSNVASVLLARAVARRQEIAVRLAIGARRSRLVAQLLTETFLIFIAGGAAGFLVARGMTSFLLSFFPAIPIPIHVSLALDGRVFLFTATLSMVAAFLAGLVPAWQSSRADVTLSLKDASQSSRENLRLRNVFVTSQVALSILLVVSAGLLVRALERAASIEPGFDPSGIELADIDLSLGGYTSETGKPFVRDLLQRVRGIPGVQSAAAATIVPLSGGMVGAMGVGGLTVPGVPPPQGQRFFMAQGNIVEPGYFAAMKLPLVEGRDFTAADRQGTPTVAIIGEATARRFWPGQSALGKEFFQQPNLFARGNTTAPQPQKIEVIGVARDPKYVSLTEDHPPVFVYLPLQQRYQPAMTLIVRSSDGRRLAGDIRRAISDMNRALPVISMRTIEDGMQLSLAPQRVAAWVSGSLGSVGLLLASIGIYGVLAYAVTRRTREIGIRMALGAQRADVIRMVLRQGMSLVLIGGLLGLALAAAAARVLVRLLLGVPPIDPVTFSGAAVLFALVGLAACYVPVRRATRIAAIDALRHD